MSDTWPVRRQTYGYLPSHKVSPPIGWYQIILLGVRGTRVLTTCPGLQSIIIIIIIIRAFVRRTMSASELNLRRR